MTQPSRRTRREVEPLLARAGLLVPPAAPRRRPDSAAVALARRAAGRGTPLSNLVAEERE